MLNVQVFRRPADSGPGKADGPLSNSGILIPSHAASPFSVRLELHERELAIDTSGRVELVPLNSLRKLNSDPFLLKLGRTGRRGWELRLSGALAIQLRAQIGDRRRQFRWGAAKAWHLGLFIGTMLIIELVKVPPEWLAPLLPASVERRLISDDVRSEYASYCESDTGDGALRALLARLDPAIARSVRIQVVGNEGDFLITSLPGNRLYVSNAFLTTTDPEELAALLAHEVAHLKNGDAVRAALRASGTIGGLIGRFVGDRKPEDLLVFSSTEERSADQQALSMLMAGGISTRPGATLFERMEQERKANRSFGKEQYYMHFGFGEDRAAAWRDVPDKSAEYWVRPALSAGQADALFNYCHLSLGPRRTPLPKN